MNLDSFSFSFKERESGRSYQFSIFQSSLSSFHFTLLIKQINYSSISLPFLPTFFDIPARSLTFVPSSLTCLVS